MTRQIGTTQTQTSRTKHAGTDIWEGGLGNTHHISGGEKDRVGGGGMGTTTTQHTLAKTHSRKKQEGWREEKKKEK